MKRFFLTMLCLLLICTFALSLSISLIQALPNTIYVDGDNISGPWDGTPEHPYQNITSGLAQAVAGDVIYVYEGTYFEQLLIDKPISLCGEDEYYTVIDGNNTANVIRVTANNVNITHFTIRNSLSVFGFSGIRLDHSNGNNISYNIITRNYEGIWLENSNSNTFIDNYVSNSGEGIYAVSSSNNIFMNNMISNNEFGIVLRESSNNTVFHNSFLNNTWRSVSIINSINSWDNGIEGNYWSDYKGADDDHDAIGDTPYIINENNQDNHPTMGAFSDFTVIYEKETYHILTICNSTIYQFQFNETLKMLNFNVIGINNTAGFCRIQFPEQLINRPYIVLVDDEQVNATLLPISNATHTFLYFTYDQNTREVKIISNPFYELMQKYNAFLEKYNNLNLTYYQLLARYTQLLIEHSTLNKTYQDTLSNYTMLQNEYHSLNQTYWRLLANNAQLQTDYDSLNQTLQHALTNYTSLLLDYNALLQQYYSSNSTYKRAELEYANMRVNFWYISIAAIAIVAITSSLTIRYRRKSEEQKKIAEKYKSELERVSLIDTARAQFEADAQRRKEKIRKFQNKYGVTVRPRDTLEDIITSLELKKEKTQQ